jgi:dTDP-4-dehydrorhamnose 3,5-epimerase
MDLLENVRLTRLDMHSDARGSFTEFFRDEWAMGVSPCQWNVAISRANVLRGAHVHLRHSDYLVVVRGRLSVGLFDLRPGSRTYTRSALIELSGERLTGLSIPPGVMHGFYAHESSVHIYGVDAYYDPEDELGCNWADPDLGIAWPCSAPKLSPRDRDAGSLAEVQAQYLARSADGGSAAPPP